MTVMSVVWVRMYVIMGAMVRVRMYVIVGAMVWVRMYVIVGAMVRVRMYVIMGLMMWVRVHRFVFQISMEGVWTYGCSGKVFTVLFLTMYIDGNMSA